jgi:hypothetical protein
MLRGPLNSATLQTELKKTAKTQNSRAISDNFLSYRVKTRYKHNGGFVLSPGPAVPRGEHFDENHTGEG